MQLTLTSLLIFFYILSTASSAQLNFQLDNDGPVTDSERHLIVQTSYGLIKGRIDRRWKQIRQFLGIPFALPPIGPLRWTKPQPPIRWSHKIYEATRIPPACLQSAPLPFERQSEDCLYLSVYTPILERHSAAERPLPVMVWYHGGAWILGSSFMAGVQDPSFIVEHRDVVIVSVNYRLGPIGFLASDKLGGGNFGLHDQIEALRWVQKNIEAFGGDKNRVTIWGESAGAMSVGMLVTSPLTRGLFHRAIMQSNVLGISYRTVEEAAAIGQVLAKRVGCVDIDDLDCLRQVNGVNIIRYRFPVGIFNSRRLLGDALVWAPVIDNHTITGQPRDLLPAAADHIPILIGFNRDETAFAQSLMDIIFGNVLGSPEPMITNDIYRALVGKVFRNDSLRVLSAYPPDAAGNITKNIDQIIELTTDYLARCPTIAMALRRSTAPVYLYSFDFVAEFPPKWFLQRCLTRHVCHAMEIPYVFHSMQHWPMLRKFSSAEQNISLSLISYWTEFASGEKLTLSNVLSHMPRWSNWYPVSSSNSTDQYYWMRFGLPDIARVNLGNPKRELCDLWESTGYRY